ncbi:uncharacterized protein LOC143841330 [Paroedura picta]|uniref:uncharacterized protein LOC143841330 n=1 Tax=Paroedura picta TaxID=143630 RepID=UPI0010142AB5
MAHSSKTPSKIPGRRASLTSEEETPSQISRARRPDGCSSRSSPLRKQNSSSSLRSEGQSRGSQLPVSRSRRSESFSDPDPAVLSLVQAMARTGVALSEAELFEDLLLRQLGPRRTVPALPQLYHTFLPALGRLHESTLRRAIRHRDAFIFLHEETAGEGRASLGISVLPLDRAGHSPLLLGVEFVEQLSHILVARAVARVLSEGHVLFHRVLAVVTPGGAHMRQAFDPNGVLNAVLLSALHVPCLLHQLELVMELWPERLEKLTKVLPLLEDTFGRCAALRHRYERFLQNRQLDLSLPGPSVRRGPEAWLERAIGVAEHLDVLAEFLAGDEEEGTAVARLKALLTERNEDLLAEATFVTEHAAGLLSAARFLRRVGEPVAHRIYGELDSLRISFSYHLDMRLGPETERHLGSCSPQLAEQFNAILALSLARLERLIDTHPAMPTLRAVRALDPKQLGSVGWSRLEHEEGIPGLAEVPEIEWFRYQRLAEAAPADISLPQWWEAQAEQLPMLSPLARRYLWLPVCTPKSPFPPGGILSPLGAEAGFTEDSARLLCMLRYNRRL